MEDGLAELAESVLVMLDSGAAGPSVARVR
jgi:hypothetical protein